MRITFAVLCGLLFLVSLARTQTTATEATTAAETTSVASTAQGTTADGTTAVQTTAAATTGDATTQSTTSVATTSDATTAVATTAVATTASIGPITTGVATTGTASNSSTLYPAPKFNYFLTQNNNWTYVAPQAGIACVTPPPTQYHRPHKYYRLFTLADFGITGSFQVTAVSFGIERAIARQLPCQPIYVSLYYKTSPSTIFNENDLVLIRNASYALPDMNLGFWTVPISGTVPAGTTLVVTLEVVDGLPTQSIIFMGANKMGERSPSYLVTEACRVNVPTPYSLIGFPNTSLVWMVSNDTSLNIPDWASMCPCVVDSCTRYCGARPWCSISDCWCDGACTAYGDCCTNMGQICQGLPNTTANGTQSSGGGFTTPEYATTAAEAKSDLTPGEKAGIAVGVIIAVIIGAVVAVIVVAFIIVQTRRRKLRKAKLEQYEQDLAQKENANI